MILIVGRNNDDVLYFKTFLKRKTEEVILNKYTITKGSLFNQEVVLLENVYSSYLSSALVSYIIQKYFVILVFSVGKCAAYSENLEIGDIVLSRGVVLGDVNFSQEEKVQKGQLPLWNRYFTVNNEIFQLVASALEHRTFSSFTNVTFVASNAHLESVDQLYALEENNEILGIQDRVVFDSEIGGIAVTCALHDIPFVGIKVVSTKVGETETLDNYIKVLDKYSSLGKAIISVIGEISRNDIIR